MALLSFSRQNRVDLNLCSSLSLRHQQLLVSASGNAAHIWSGPELFAERSCVTGKCFLLREPGFVLYERACVSACMCMHCMFLRIEQDGLTSRRC